MQVNETELARRLMQGDAGAFDAFVAHFRGKIFQYSMLNCGQREDAEEIAQETLLKVFQNWHQLREPERIRSWVFRIAKNACLMHRRRPVDAPQKELSLDELMPRLDRTDGGPRIEIADWRALPDAQAMNSELREKMGAAIRALPDIYRMTLLLRDVEGLSTLEAAEVLDVSEDVVKTRLHRARLALRQSLDEQFRAEGARR